MKSYVVARVGEIADGGRRVVKVRGRDIVVFNLEGEYYALLDKCPHRGASLACGPKVGLLESREQGDFRFSENVAMVRCPWHGWEYDIRTGQSYCDPENINIRKYAARTEQGGELVRGPYVADTFPVSVDDDYVIVSM